MNIIDRSGRRGVLDLKLDERGRLWWWRTTFSDGQRLSGNAAGIPTLDAWLRREGLMLLEDPPLPLSRREARRMKPAKLANTLAEKIPPAVRLGLAFEHVEPLVEHLPPHWRRFVKLLFPQPQAPFDTAQDRKRYQNRSVSKLQPTTL